MFPSYSYTPLPSPLPHVTGESQPSAPSHAQVGWEHQWALSPLPRGGKGFNYNWRDANYPPSSLCHIKRFLSSASLEGPMAAPGPLRMRRPGPCLPHSAQQRREEKRQIRLWQFPPVSPYAFCYKPLMAL